MNTDSGSEEGEAAKPRHRVVLRLRGKAQARSELHPAWLDLPRKAAALLALLIVDGPTAREKTASLLWPDVAGDKPRANLRGLLRDLRRLVGSELTQTSDPLELMPGIEHDLGDDITSDAAVAPGALLLDALDYSDLDEFTEWLQRAREQRKSQRKRQGLESIERHARRGDFKPAIEVAERLVTFDLLDEHSHRVLMRLLYESGDPAAATAAFARCRAVLARAHDDAEPSLPTRQLATLIDTGQPLPAPMRLPASQPDRTVWPLVARDTECREIEAAWAQGQRVLLEGEAGIGKSRLLLKLQDGHPGRSIVSAKQGDAEVTYALLARLLRTLLEARGSPVEESHADELARLLPELGRMPPYPANTPRLVEALAAALQAWHDNGLEILLIDDLHWADTASTNLLLAAQGRVRGLCWLFAVRPRMHPSTLTVELAAQLRDTASSWYLVQPRPLDSAAVEALLQTTPWVIGHRKAWAEVLAQRALGNPLQVIETLRALDQVQGGRLLQSAPPPADRLPVPQTLQALTQARLSGLSGPALKLAQLAALAGAVFSVKLAVQVLQASEFELATQWVALEQHGVLDREGLAHDAFREPLLELLPPPVARELHARVAQVASGLGAAAAELAPHWLQAREWSEAALALEAAARVAFSQNARVDELRLCDQAAECRERSGDPSAVFADRLQAFDAAVELLPSERALARMEVLLRTARGASQSLDASIAAARLDLSRTNFESGLVHADRAVELARGLVTAHRESGQPRLLRAMFLQTQALAGLGRHAEALNVAEPLRGEVETSGDPRLLLDLCDVIGYANGQASRWTESFAAYSRSAALAEQLGNLTEAAISSANLALNLHQQGRLEQALSMARKSEALRLRLGAKDAVSDTSVQRLVGLLEHRLGRFEPAIEALGSALRLSRLQQSPLLTASSETALARVHVDLGDPVMARSFLTPWPTGKSDAGRIGRLLVEFDIHGLEGGDAAPPSMEVMASVWRNEPLSTQWGSELSLIRILRPTDAVQRCQRIAMLAGQAGAAGIEISALLLQANALREFGDLPASVERLEAALRRLPECRPTTLYFAEVWWIAFGVFKAEGRLDEARQALETGRRWILEEALPQVPGEFKQSFLERNWVNRLLLSAA